jgi:hypothetical protein
MPTTGTPRKSYRIRPVTLSQITEIAKQKGFTATRVLELAVAELHRMTFGLPENPPRKEKSRPPNHLDAPSS